MPITPAARAALSALYEHEQLTQTEIARSLGVHRTSIARWLREAGIAIRPRGPRPGRSDPSRKISSIVAVDRAVELVRAGKTVSEAAREIGIARQTLYRNGFLARLRASM